MLKKLQKIVIFRQKLLFQLFGHHSLLLFLALLLEVLGRDAKLLEEKLAEVALRRDAHHIADVAYAVLAFLNQLGSLLQLN